MFGINSTLFQVLWTRNKQNYEQPVKTVQVVRDLHKDCSPESGAKSKSQEDHAVWDSSHPQRGNRSGNREAGEQRESMANFFFDERQVENLSGIKLKV